VSLFLEAALFVLCVGMLMADRRRPL
jgi:hypothetical protein